MCVCFCMTVPEPACASQLELCCSPCCQADFGHMTIRQWLLQLWITTSLNQRWPEEERGGGSRESSGNEEGRDSREAAGGKIMREDVGMCGAVTMTQALKTWVMWAPCTTYLCMLRLHSIYVIQFLHVACVPLCIKIFKIQPPSSVALANFRY